MPSKILIRCAGCEQPNYSRLYTAPDLGLTTFSINNPEDLQALRLKYDPREDEGFMITTTGMFVHNVQACLAKAKAGFNTGAPLAIFLQLLYLSLKPDLQLELESLLHERSGLRNIGKSEHQPPAFKVFFDQTLISMVKHSQSESTLAVVSAEHLGLECWFPSPSVPPQTDGSFSFTSQGGQKAGEQFSLAMNELYHTLIKSSSLPLDSPLKKSMEQARPRAAVSPAAPSEFIRPKMSSLGGLSARSTPHGQRLRAHSFSGVTPSSFSTPQDQHSGAYGSSGANPPRTMNTIWELRENFLTDPSSEVAPRLSLVEQLEIKVKEVVLALTENTKPQADSIRIYNELFGRILAGEDIFKVLISVLEEGGYHVVKKGQLSPPRAGAHHKYAAESLTAAVLTTVANASQQTVDDAYVNCQRSLAALQREYQEQKDFFEARSSAIIAKNIEFRLLKGEKEKLIYANKCLILMMTLIALFPVT